MSDHHQAAYVSTNATNTPIPASAAHFDQPFYTNAVTMPQELASYGMSYNHYFMAGDLQPTVVSDHFYEQPECMTPLSQHSMLDGASVSPDVAGCGMHTNNLDLISVHSMSSPATFITPTWTPEPMNFEEHHEASMSVTASPRPESRPPPVHQHTGSSDSSSTVTATPGPRKFAPIAPQPITPNQKSSLKRSAARDEMPLQSPRPKRKRSSSPTSSNPHADLSAEDDLLLRLKDEEELSWKDIQKRFATDFNKTYQIPALQMRIKRLKERLRIWTEPDLEALNRAHEYYNDMKFEIISAKMLEFGAVEKWSAKQCFQKWHEIAPQQNDYFQPSFQTTPTFQPISYSPGFARPRQSADAYQAYIATSA